MLNDEIEEKILSNVIAGILRDDYDSAIRNIPDILKRLYANIPDNKRISYGIVHTVKVLSEYLYTQLTAKNVPIYTVASTLFSRSNDTETRGVCLGMLSLYGQSDYKTVLPYFETAAASSDWNPREFAQLFFRKIIKCHPEQTGAYLLRLTKSSDANIRRFVAETLRPVQENRWFYKNPDYPLSILSKMFKESSAYPRTSVGNNLSDLARHLPDLVYSLVEELVGSGDKNSYWIACRACRNLVKKEPIKVMNLLKIDEYKYKKAVYKRSALQGN